MKKTEKKSADEKKRRKNSGKISLKTSRLKWWLQETPPTNLCPVRSVWDVSLRYPCWNGAYMDLLPQHMHAEILPTGTPPTNQYPVYYTVCFSHESRSHRDLPQQTYAQYIILYRMFLLHIQAEIVPTRISPHKPVSNTFSKGCFSSMSKLKWCLRETPTNSCPLHSFSVSLKPAAMRTTSQMIVSSEWQLDLKIENWRRAWRNAFHQIASTLKI